MKNPFAIQKPIPSAFGLSLSDLSLKIIYLKKLNDRLSFTGYSQSKIPPGYIINGEIKKEKEVADLIKKSLENFEGGTLNTHHAVVSLPEPKVFLRAIELPKIREKEIRETIKWEAEANIPLPLKEVYLDWQIIKSARKKNKHIDVLVAAAPKKIVDSYISTIQKAGLKIDALEPESLAITRSIIKDAEFDKTVLIINIGGARTNFVVVSGSYPRFASSTPVSGEYIDKSIAVATNTKDYNKIEEIKTKIGLDKNKSDGKIFDALVPVITDLAEQTQKYINFYNEHATSKRQSGKNIEKIILSGKEAGLAGLAPHLSLEIKLPVEIANPWINILEEPLREVPELPFEKSLSYTTAIGLAIRGARL